MPSQNRKNNLAIVSAAKKKKISFYYKGSDFGIIDDSEVDPRDTIYQDFQYKGMNYNKGYTGHGVLGGVVQFSRGDVVQNHWSVPIYGDLECTEKTGVITWDMCAQITDNTKLFSEQNLLTTEKINVKFTGGDNNFDVNGVSSNSLYGGYYTLDKDVIVKLSKNLVEIGPFDKNDRTSREVHSYKTLRIRKINSDKRQCLLSSLVKPEEM